MKKKCPESEADEWNPVWRKVNVNSESKNMNMNEYNFMGYCQFKVSEDRYDTNSLILHNVIQRLYAIVLSS